MRRSTAQVQALENAPSGRPLRIEERRFVRADCFPFQAAYTPVVRWQRMRCCRPDRQRLGEVRVPLEKAPRAPNARRRLRMSGAALTRYGSRGDVARDGMYCGSGRLDGRCRRCFQEIRQGIAGGVRFLTIFQSPIWVSPRRAEEYVTPNLSFRTISGDRQTRQSPVVVYQLIASTEFVGGGSLDGFPPKQVSVRFS